MKLVGLSRQLALAMGATALAVAVLIVATSFVFYYFAFKWWPEQFQEGWGIPTIHEWLWITATTLAGVLLAVVVAGHLAKRILVPLSSLTEAIRRVAAGDLSARASAGPRPLAEAAVLVEDFNRLAGELARVTEERVFWNAAIAHELRTPVTILQGRLQALADGVFRPEESQFRRLLAQVEGLARLVEDLRSISLAESGHLDLRWQAVDLRRELGDVVESFRAPLEAVGQTATLDAPAMPVWCDPVRMRQGVIALLDNARRYASAGEVRTRVSMIGPRCVVCVEDAGPGLAPELRGQVFEAFRRAGQTRDRQERSSGLGLAVVAAIAQAHGGTATCRESALGGTCFEISWPAARAPEGAVSAALSA